MRNAFFVLIAKIKIFMFNAHSHTMHTQAMLTEQMDRRIFSILCFVFFNWFLSTGSISNYKIKK